MSVEILTKEDLQAFRIQLLNDIKTLLFIKQNPNMEWLRSSEIRKTLKISAGTLQNLRITCKLKPAKIGGILFYRNSDLEKLLDSGNQNSKVE
ncbi:MAG: helix-turn-helix domain-containing protein [Ferruginibacter sp.]